MKQMNIIEKTAIDLGIDLKNDSTVLADAGRKIHEKLKDTALKGWEEDKTSKFIWNKYNKKRRKRNEDVVDPPGEEKGTV